jgi:hypothetical protein
MDLKSVLRTWRRGFRYRQWLPTAIWTSLRRRPRCSLRPVHFIVAIADHFEPTIDPKNPLGYVDYDEQVRRVDAWCHEYPKAVTPWRDSDGQPLRHTYFYPAEQHDDGLIDRLAGHCRDGWGEIEIHLHHGVHTADSADNTRKTLLSFRDALATRGCLSRWDGVGQPGYVFVHGNWALANSAGGSFCGVDDEMQILAETGCYADMTLPSAPSIAQVAKMNALYECALPLDRRAPHRKGRDLCSGRPPHKFPLIISGPLSVDVRRQKIENGALTAQFPPTIERFWRWRHANITVRGRPEWVFIKLHCHGMDPRDTAAMYGEPLQRFLQQLTDGARAGGDYRLHFVTAREMVNIVLAACDGRPGNPGDYRDYRLRLNPHRPPGRP